MDSLILNNKISPGIKQPKIIPRNNLVKSLISNADKNLICVIAGAGYGKTTSVNEFLNSAKFNFSWYKIDESDENIFLFFDYLINSIKLKEKSFGNNSLVILNSLKSRTSLKSDLKSIINTIAGTFLNEFNRKITKNFYIILDDFHLLPKDEWISALMQYLLENIPKNLHFIITTREKLPFDMATLKAKRKYFELNTEDLRFREHEVNLLSNEIYEKSLTAKESEIIRKKFDGWVTGLHLFFQSTEKNDIYKIESRLPKNLYDFFAEDIFSSKSENVKKFLINTCLLDNFLPSASNYLLHISNSDKIIEQLIDGNVFINRQEIQQDNKTIVVYSYQELFKDFLVSKFNENNTEEGKKEHYKKIAEYYIQSNNDIKSIKFFLLAEEYNKCIELILKNISAVLDTGNMSLINYWLKSLPEKLKSNNPYILYYLGCINKGFYGNFEDALKCFENALKYLKPSDKYFFIKSNTHIAEILISFGNTEKSKEQLTGLLKKKMDDESKANLLYWLAVSYKSESEYDKSIKLLHQSLDLATTENNENLRNDISNELGNVYLIRGDFIKSLFYYENVIHHTKNIYKKFHTLTNIVQLYAHSGQYEKSKRTLDEAYEMQEMFPTPFFKIIYLLAETHLCYMIGDYEKTIELLEQFMELVKKRNLSYYIYLSYISLGYCYFYLKKYSKTAKYYDMAKQFLEELNETEKIDFGFSNAVLRKETDFSPVIEKDLKTAYGYFEKNYLVYNNVQAGFHLADYFLHDENYDKAKDYLKESLLTISENEYVSYLKAEIFAKRDIFDFAIVNKIQTEFIFTIFRDTASILNVEWISDEYRKRLESEVETLYDMKLECFGDIIIKKRGIPVDEEKWLRRIRKIIFVYIMLNQKKVITKENIIEFFYSESSLENANSAFHQTLTNIRSIFNFDNKFTNSKITFPFLTCSDKIIQFNPNYFYYVDVVEFEKLYKKAMGYGIPEKEKIKYIEQAIEIYKGKFLEGYYYDWCEKLREKYVSMHLNLLENILEIYTIRNDYKKIIYYSEKILLSDNLNEKAYLDIIKSEVSLGNLAAANKIHIRMIETFNTELKKTPPKDTISKIKLLLKT